MKAAIVSTRVLDWQKKSLLASDYLCADEALMKSIDRLEKQEKTIATSLANKRAELAESQRREDLLVARGDLTLLGGGS